MEEWPYWFPERLHKSISPPAVAEGFLPPTASLVFITIYFPLIVVKRASQYIFNVHFPDS